MNILDKGTRVMSQNPHFSDKTNPQLYKKKKIKKLKKKLKMTVILT